MERLKAIVPRRNVNVVCALEMIFKTFSRIIGGLRKFRNDIFVGMCKNNVVFESYGAGEEK